MTRVTALLSLKKKKEKKTAYSGYMPTSPTSPRKTELKGAKIGPPAKHHDTCSLPLPLFRIFSPLSLHDADVGLHERQQGVLRLRARRRLRGRDVRVRRGRRRQLRPQHRQLVVHRFDVQLWRVLREQIGVGLGRLSKGGADRARMPCPGGGRSYMGGIHTRYAPKHTLRKR